MWIGTARLNLAPFALADAPEVFACITPAITRFLPWDPPTWDTYLARCEASVHAPDPNARALVVRRRDTNDCIGRASVEDVRQPCPEIGLWLREGEHGRGYGREVVTSLVQWVSETLGADGVEYPVAVHNVSSRRIAERLDGRVVATRSTPKYEVVVYRIPGR